MGSAESVTYQGGNQGPAMSQQLGNNPQLDQAVRAATQELQQKFEAQTQQMQALIDLRNDMLRLVRLPVDFKLSHHADGA